ncbi:GGDEF domain-containing protein [Marinicella rhabdoformis]|uniref:GGDEF domain-containing protein n=1 Tax=Marinicella rhabdoformis TaxID=2580566 RepID=UPI0012AEDDDD|nr:GGDEF domain-containing protein [Marinicella rhabdoformis]
MKTCVLKQLIILVIIMGPFSTASSNVVDNQLNHLYEIKTSDIPSFIAGIERLKLDKEAMSDEQSCLFDFLSAQIPYYKGEFAQALKQNKQVIKKCPNSPFELFGHVQNALVYSVTSEYVMAFESLQRGEKLHRELTMTDEYLKYYLSGAAMVLVNLSQYNSAEDKLLALEHLAENAPEYLCRIMFNRLNIALSEKNYQYSSEDRLQEVTMHCEQANEHLYLQFSQTIWHYFKFINNEYQAIDVKAKLDNHLSNESKVLELNYPYLSSAYYATLAQGFYLLDDHVGSKKYAKLALSYTSLGNVIFKVTAMDVLINVLDQEGNYQAAFELLNKKSQIEQNQQFELKSKNMAYAMVAQAVGAKENTIRLLNEQNAVLLHNEQLKDEQNRLQLMFIISLLVSLILLFLILWRVWSKLNRAKLETHLDYLTKTSNRKGFEKKLAEVFKRNDVVHTEVQFGLMNLDDFRVLNDEIGHHAGDYFLIDLVKRCESMLPENAFMGRTGGEEFCFVLYNATQDEMKSFLNLMREHIMNQQFIYQDDEMKLTASFGFTSAAPGMNSYEKLIGQAERALFQAKLMGKNQVVYY